MSKFDWIDDQLDLILDSLDHMEIDEQVGALNYIRQKLHDRGPFKNEPVDLVLWVNSKEIKGNDYNPNKVAPPEMDLLKRSIEADGYTQPIVGFPNAKDGKTHEVVDGFHRYTIGSTVEAIKERMSGYLPLVEIRHSQSDESNRIASTIRHNRARGSHDIDSMVSIVGELVEAGMSDEWITKNIGMDKDELLRLKQVSGLAALFKDKEFSKAWEAKDE